MYKIIQMKVTIIYDNELRWENALNVYISVAQDISEIL